MPLNKHSPYFICKEKRYRQGDILRDVTVVQWAEVVDGALAIIERNLPYAVVLSQECDLEHDFNSRSNAVSPNMDKFLPSILLCPAYLAAQLKEGTHLETIQMKMHRIPTEHWKGVKQHNNYRYHFLVEDQDLQLPELTLDFKHFFTIPRAVIYREKYEAHYVCSLDDLFREHLSSRFANYLSRIGLPELVAPTPQATA